MKAEHKTLSEAIRPHMRIVIFIGLVLSLAVNVLMLTGPVYMLQIYGRVLPSNSIETLFALSILMTVMFVGLGVLDLVRFRLLTRVARRIGVTLRERLFDLSTHIMATTGNMAGARRPQADIEVVSSFIGGPAIIAFLDAPFTPFYIFIIWLFHPYLAMFAFFATVLLFLMGVANEYQLRRPQKKTVETQGKTANLLQELLGIVEVIRTLGMSEQARRRWSRLQDGYLEAQMNLRDRSLGFSAMAKAVRLFLQSVMLGLGAWLVLRQEIHAGMMIAASIMLGRALYPAEQAITHWRSFKQARAAWRRLDADLQALDTLPAIPTLAPETDCKGKLEARGLFVAPPGQSKPVLRNINFIIKPGQLLLVTGVNGAGKSTLARALAGFWQPLGTGKVLLDDVDIRGWPEKMRGRLLGYMPQNVHLVNGTIAENICRLSPDATEDEILAAARRIGVHDAIKKMGGVARQVGPGGQWLSAGERRKVALARAAFDDPLVYILDEPTADLDQESRAHFYQALVRLKERGRAVVLIDHGMPPAELVDLHLRLDGDGGGKLILGEKPAENRSMRHPSGGYSITLAHQ